MDDVDRLINQEQYHLTQAEKEKQLLKILKKQIKENHSLNPHLVSYYKKTKFDADNAKSIEEISPIPVQMFKMFDLITCKKKDVVRELKSSSTTSQKPSVVPINKATAFRQAEGLRSTLKDYLGIKRRPFLVIDTKDVNKKSEDLVARGIAIRGISGFGKDITYVLDSDEDGRLTVNMQRLKEFTQKHKDEEILVFGFTYILWSVFVEAIEKIGMKLCFKDVVVFHSGGWKKLIDQQVSKDVFSSKVAGIFSADKKNVIDFYGMAEQSGIIFPDCAFGYKHAPDFADVILRDPLTMKEVRVGGVGLIEIASTLSDSYPAQAILTEDVGELAGIDDCKCGRKGKYFIFKSRIKKAEVRGCGDTYAEKDMQQGGCVSLSYNESGSDVRCLLIDGRSEDQKDMSMEKIRDIIEMRRKELYEMPLEAIIGVFNDYAKKLIKDTETRKIEGVAYLSNWCRRSNIEKIVKIGLSYPDAIDHPEKIDGMYLKAQPKGVVCQWIAGNIPTLALYSYIQSVICRNGNIIRASRRNVDETQVLLEKLKDASFEYKGRKYSGMTILKSTALVSFESSDETANRDMSLTADCKVMWGGSEAINSIRNLPQKEYCTNIVFGPKYSFGVIDKEMVKDVFEGKDAELFNHIIDDIITFEQAACSSPQVLFFEKSGVSLKKIAERLGESFAKRSERYPKKDIDISKAAEIINIRAEYALSEDKDVVFSYGNDWTILMNRDVDLEEPVHSRIIFIKEIDDIFDAVPLVTRKIQTIGTAIKKEDRYIKFAELASYKGALRFTPFGQMNTQENPWDGMLVMDNLVNWISIRR